MTMQKRDEMNAAVFERVVSTGDLSVLSPEQRLHYVAEVCAQLGLNPLTSGFQYISFDGKLQMYAGRQTAAQLASLRSLDVRLDYTVPNPPSLFVVKATATDGTRMVEDIGVVDLTGLKGKAVENGMMKAITKAKRRAVLGFTGMGILDESEIDNLAGAAVVTVDPETGEIHEAPDRNVVDSVNSPHAKPHLEAVKVALDAGDIAGAQAALDRARNADNAGHHKVQEAIANAEEAIGLAASAVESDPEPAAAPDPGPETPDAPEPVEEAPAPAPAEDGPPDLLELLGDWCESHGHALADVGDVLKMPWDEWVKMFGDAALERAKVRLGVEWDIDVFGE